MRVLKRTKAFFYATVLFLILLAPPFNLRAVAASSAVPLDKGTRWIYEGKVEWTAPGADKARQTNVQWITEVTELFQSRSAQAAVVRGFPDELVWYEPGQPAGYSVLLCLSNKVYHLSVKGDEGQANDLARKLVADSPTVPEGADELMELPLTVGRKTGQVPSRDDTWYCWCVEQVEARAPRIRGFRSHRSLKTYHLAYRTCPDHQILEVVPGLGIIRFVYNHHGTVSSADVRLVSFQAPGGSR